MELSLYRRHQIFLKVTVKLSELRNRTGKARVGIVVIKCGGHKYRRRNIALSDHIVQHIRDVCVLKILTCMTAPAVNQVADVVACFGVVFIVAVGKIDLCGLSNIALVTDKVLAVISDLRDCSCLFDRLQYISGTVVLIPVWAISFTVSELTAAFGIVCEFAVFSCCVPQPVRNDISTVPSNAKRFIAFISFAPF